MRAGIPVARFSAEGKVRPVALVTVLIFLCLLLPAGYWAVRVLFDPLRLPYGQWKEFTRRYISPEGRVIDTGNGNISHSEGQGYGMLLAEAYGDREGFEKIWLWTRKNLQVREDNLFAWKWEPDHGGGGRVSDPNNASDGDLIIAWALYRASKRWNEESYAKATMQILVDLRETCFVKAPSGPVLLPGQFGFTGEEGEVVLNPSYYVFPALMELAGFSMRESLSEIRGSGLKLCMEARFGVDQLISDWVIDGPSGFQLPEDERFPAVFGYNAIRVPLNLAWDRVGKEQLAPYVNFWKSIPAGEMVPAVVQLPGGEFGPNPALPGMLAVADFTKAAAEGKKYLPRDVPSIIPDESYYSASLKMLAILAARDSAKSAESD